MSEPTTKNCPYCMEEIRVEAIKCRHCGSYLNVRPLTQAVTNSWYRSREGKAIAGVCMGLAKQFNISVTILRLAFILGAFIGGWCLIIYVALWLIMPWEPKAGPDQIGPGVSGHHFDPG